MKKHERPFDTKCRAYNIAYKSVASADGYSSKVYLVTAEDYFKQGFYRDRMSLVNEGHFTDKKLSKYV